MHLKQITDYSGARRCGAVFEELVGLIDKIKDDSIGEWIVDKENDGISRCIAKIYVRSLSK